MSKFFPKLFVFFLLCLKLNGQTNVYHPFPDSNTVWNIRITNGFQVCPTDPTNMLDYSFEIAGDTIVGNYSYHKVSVPYWPDSTCFVNPILFGIIGFRQDIPNRKVYSIYANNTNEFLLFDFNMQLGDTFSNFQCVTTITGIDSLLIGGNYRKRWKLNNTGNFYTNYIIEGIGSTWDVQRTAPCSNILNDEDNYDLICFKQNGITLYPDTLSVCDLVLTSNSIENNRNHISIFPNPFSLSTTINTNGIFKDATILIYNSFGQQVKEIKNISEPTITLFRDNLSNGIYFIRLKKGGSFFTNNSFVIMD